MVSRMSVSVAVFLSAFALLMPIRLLAQESPYGDNVEVAGPSRTGTYAEGLTAGRIEAKQPGMAAWTLAGLGGGCLLSGIGCLATSGIAYVIEPSASSPVDAHLRTDAYVQGYREGYRQQLKKRRATSAFIGGSIGTLIVVLLYVLAYSAPPAE